MRLNFIETDVYIKTRISYNYSLPETNIYQHTHTHTLANKIYSKCTVEYPSRYLS